ncbi:hypothetical protein EZS27_018358 [termite gut metagenome]|uniref:Uncharacterized protein n=1 Tax=termite gut metagenome TaxID=433724 RepID=A0A5J4RK22_9ZZZZ
MNTEELLEKYFDGRTTCKEEKRLRKFFSHNRPIPEHLQVYRPLFAYLDEEARRNKTLNPKRRATALKRPLLYTLGGVAAGLLLILGVAGMNRYWNEHHDNYVCYGNYVFIDGHQYTDIDLVRQQAQSALNEVRVSREEIFMVLFAE